MDPRFTKNSIESNMKIRIKLTNIMMPVIAENISKRTNKTKTKDKMEKPCLLGANLNGFLLNP